MVVTCLSVTISITQLGDSLQNPGYITKTSPTDKIPQLAWQWYQKVSQKEETFVSWFMTRVNDARWEKFKRTWLWASGALREGIVDK